MPPTKPISLPAGYAPAFAIGYSGPTGDLAVVDGATPLPVALSASTVLSVQQASVTAPAALEGSATAALLTGPFTPQAGRPVMITLSGTWQGQVQVQRSADAGATRHKLTAAGLPWGNYTGNACEVVWIENEDAARLYLDIAVTSGTLTYRIAQ